MSTTSTPPVSVSLSSSIVDSCSPSDPSSPTIPPPPSSSNPALNTLIGLVLSQSLSAIDHSVENVFQSQDQLSAQLDRLSNAIQTFHTIQKNFLNNNNNNNNTDNNSSSDNNNNNNSDSNNNNSSNGSSSSSETKIDPSTTTANNNNSSPSSLFPPLSSYSTKINSAKKRVTVLQKSLGVINKRIESMKEILLKKYPPIPNNQNSISGRTNSASNPPPPSIPSSSSISSSSPALVSINDKKINNGDGGNKEESSSTTIITDNNNNNDPSEINNNDPSEQKKEKDLVEQMKDYETSIRRSTGVIEELVDWNSS